MGTIVVERREGEVTTIGSEFGRNLMEVLRSNGAEEIMALCGGTCSCCTCHVIVAPEFVDTFAPMKSDEDELLESSNHRVKTSRLSCQVIFVEAMDGMRIKIAPED